MFLLPSSGSNGHVLASSSGSASESVTVLYSNVQHANGDRMRSPPPHHPPPADRPAVITAGP